jgi:hypothetical protein
MKLGRRIVSLGYYKSGVASIAMRIVMRSREHDLQQTAPEIRLRCRYYNKTNKTYALARLLKTKLIDGGLR